MSELLPCPFCGGEAKILTAESMHGGNLYGVMCDCCAGRADVYDTEAEAIEAWNTRADTATLYEDGFYLHGRKFVPERTCELTLDGTDGCFGCSECYENIPQLANYCPNCGCKVVSA